MKKLLIILFLLICVPSYSAPPTRTQTYTSGEVISSSEVTENEDNIFNYLQAGVDTYADGTIINADVKSTAGVTCEKLALGSCAQDIGITAAGSFDNNGTTTLDGAVTITGAQTLSGAIDLNAKITADTFEIEGSNFDINGGKIDGVTLGADTAVDATIGTMTATTVTITTATTTTDTITTANITTLKVGTTNQGDILYDNGTSMVRLAAGTDGQFLQTKGASANPTWAQSNQTLIFVDRSSIANSDTLYVAPGGNTTSTTADQKSIEMPTAGTLKNLYVRTINTTSGTMVITARKNNSDGALTATIASSGTNASDTSNTMSFDAGDRLEFKVVNNRASGTQDLRISCQYE